jgi:hypothetical protein
MILLYGVSIAIHVVVAVLAVGVVGAIPLTARIARQSAGRFEGSENALGVLLRIMQVGFVVMVLTGVLLDVSMAGAFHRTGWFKASMAVLVVIGFSHARARAALRAGLQPGGVRDVALSRVERWGWSMCAAVALITILMQTKVLP